MKRTLQRNKRRRNKKFGFRALKNKNKKIIQRKRQKQRKSLIT